MRSRPTFKCQKMGLWTPETQSWSLKLVTGYSPHPVGLRCDASPTKEWGQGKCQGGYPWDPDQAQRHRPLAHAPCITLKKLWRWFFLILGFVGLLELCADSFLVDNICWVKKSVNKLSGCWSQILFRGVISMVKFVFLVWFSWKVFGLNFLLFRTKLLKGIKELADLIGDDDPPEDSNAGQREHWTHPW